MGSPLIGNERAWNILSSMIKNKRIPHALLIEGEEGLGKKTLARYIAKACLCDADDFPCLACKTCHLIDVGSHPDYQVIVPDGAAIKVDQIRALRTEAFLTPMAAKGRVFIIDRAHTMNASAQNALLKVLEEPPKGVTFILLAKSASLLLETIRSRSVCLTLSPVPLESDGFKKVADTADVSLNDAERLLRTTDGNIGLAIAYSKEEITSLSGVASELLTLATLKKRLDILTALQPYVKDRRQVAELIAELKSAVSKEIKKKAMKEYSSFTAERLNFCYNELSEIERSLLFNPSIPLVFCRIAAVLTDQ